MQNTAQLILYNQLDKRFVISGIENVFYIHHTWKINFQGKELKLNTYSRVIDYAGGSYLMDKLDKEWYLTAFIESKSFYEGILNYCFSKNIEKVFIVKPTEDYVYRNFQKIFEKLKANWIYLKFVNDTESFLLDHNEFLQKFSKPPLMEFFYRYARKEFDVLMDWNNPLWWERNFDKENRKFFKDHTKVKKFQPNKNKWFNKALDKYNFTPNFIFPTNREESLKLLDHFIEYELDNFGVYQDAMYSQDPFVYHSMLALCINFWFLSPMEVIRKVENTNTAINNKEWFIRQILGWREYMFHFFHYYKSNIYKENFFYHKRSLPSYFRGKTSPDMNCLKNVLKNVHKYNYTHHIERLMIIWNFALIAGLNPHELNRWFFEYYIDAFEWVVTPNVLWMSQFADGWKLATKPYTSSANYISKMSNYCKFCIYDKSTKYETNSCPFNFLYWRFQNNNKEILKKLRQSFVLKNLENLDLEKINFQGNNFLNKLDNK